MRFFFLSQRCPVWKQRSRN
ncbi:unnamed protein product [Timema podura]|uniref:Uncharacterized protein n=1 Tax=Timema podura TaxID=61482 RepID=A0ABN7PJP8_TIMPD|nr:unnamed protein product [Timema podura]